MEEHVVCLEPSPAECTSVSPTASIWQDVLAHAITGELLAAMNYASLSEICDDPAEIADALEHAQNERGHAAAFAAEGRKIGVEVANNVDAKHWKRLRGAFLRCIAERDFVGCLIVQEIMLESFALAQMLAKDCKDGHCEVCHASCVKPSLFEISLSAVRLRGASLQQYLKTLDMLGIPVEVTLAWVTQLPV